MASSEKCAVQQRIGVKFEEVYVKELLYQRRCTEQRYGV